MSEALRQNLELIESLDQAFSAFSHELGNSVNSLNVTLEVLLKNNHRFDDRKKLEFLERALEQAARQRRFLDAIKTYYKDGFGENELFPFLPFWRDLLAGFSEKNMTRPIRMDAASPGKPFWVAGNRIGFNRALVHVLDNAAEAVSEVDNPAIEIELIEPEKTPGAAFTTLIVRDNGGGIRRENLSKVFTPFFSTKEGRVGLGLSIARKVMTKMGGGIELAVRPEGGLEAKFAIRSFYDPADYYDTKEGRC